MRINDLIVALQIYRDKHGDVTLYSAKDDGKSSWNSPVTLDLAHKNKWPDKKQVLHHFISLNSGY